MKGKIIGLTDIDRRGDTLTVTTAASDGSLSVGDIADFEEDTSDGSYWLTIADSAPIEYTGFDEDAKTVTLAGTVGAVYEAGSPVTTWDPSVRPAGGEVADYTVSVLTDRGPVENVTLEHETIATAGVDSLDGASVELGLDDHGNPYVSRIFSRTPALDQTFIDTPFITLYLPAAELWPTGDIDGTLHVISTWEIATESSGMFSYSPSTGRLTVLEGGLYLFTLAVVWGSNSTGARYIQLDSILNGVTSAIRLVPGSPPDATLYSQQITVAYQVTAGEEFRVDAWQTSGAGLNLRGSSDGRQTQWQAVRLQA